jgi:hypothetical protein
VILQVAANPLAKALAEDSLAASFSEKQFVRESRPAEAGVYELAPEAGGPAAASVLVVPLCDGPPGSTYFLSVVGWRKAAGEDRDGEVWVGLPLADFWCYAGDIPGPDLSLAQRKLAPQRTLTPTHNLAEAVVLVGGGGAEVVNYGFGRKAPAHAIVYTKGSQLVQFDFSPDPAACRPDGSPVPMNALWARL